jgi:excisionase family DNA binding protein
MTIPEAAAYIGQTPADIERLIDQNRLPAARSASGYRIARSALDEYLNGEL